VLPKSEIIKRNNVNVIGSGDKTLLLAHGFGCDQNMWRFVVSELSKHYRIVLLDFVGSGKSDLSQYDIHKYSTLEGYAQDILDVFDALELEGVTVVGHSVGSIIALLAGIKRPEFFSKVAMVCPSPCFLNLPPDYFGGFAKEDLEELLNLMDKNYIGWAEYLAPLVMGLNNDHALIGELSESFCSTDPVVAKNFAKATFFSDYRSTLKELTHPTLIFQSKNDSLAATTIGEYMHSELPNSTMEVIDAEGHCLHMTHPKNIVNSLMSFIANE
jgi:sigma-B regulation protein RsbQ